MGGLAFRLARCDIRHERPSTGSRDQVSSEIDLHHLSQNWLRLALHGSGSIDAPALLAKEIEMVHGRTTMAVISFVGLGHMGFGMATRLLSAGHEVTIYDPGAGTADALSTMGAVHASNPREASEDAEAVFVMVRDDTISRKVWLGENSVLAADLAPQALAIECSTLSHGRVMELAEKLEARQLRYIDCPVTGVSDATASGSLTLNVGAKPEDLNAAR